MSPPLLRVFLSAIAGLGRALLVAGWWLLMPAAAHAAPVITIDRMDFSGNGHAPWATLTLPDTWSARGQPRPGRGWYRARFSLEAVPAEGLALRSDRVSSRYRLSVNGALLADRLAHQDGGQPRAMPMLLPLAPALLRVGENEVLIEVESGLRAGQTALRIGELVPMEREHRALLRAEVDLPRALSLLTAGACIFAMAVWTRRRHEVVLGSFGLLGLMASLRNYAYFEAGASLFPPVWSNFLFLASQVLSGWLLALFASALAGPRWQAWPRWVGFGALLSVLVGLVGLTADSHVVMDELRSWLLPPAMLGMVFSLGLVGAQWRRFGGSALAVITGGLVLTVVAGVHDYRFQGGHLAITHTWWGPFAIPVTLAGFGLLLMGRVAHAMSEVEVLNQGLEARVNERTRALADAHASKTRFLAAASHDLRQPVTAIGMFSELLEERLRHDAGSHPLLSKIRASVAAMDRLLQGLLDLSRLESGTQRNQPRVLRLPVLLAEAAQAESESARQRGLGLRWRCAPDLAVNVDPLLMQQVLGNLVGNAVKHTTIGGVLLTARRVDGGRHARVQVWDTGPGVAPEDRERVFEAFVQLHSQGGGGPRRGLGLGLAIARGAAERMGSRLKVRSAAGRGSCFWFDLPLVAATPAEGAALPDAAADGAPLAGWSVVLVDDEPPVRLAMQWRLAQWGAQVQAYGNVADLTAGLRGQPRPRLLVTDNRLPDGDASLVSECVRAAFPGLPVLVVTGDTDPQTVAALQARGLSVLHKPFSAGALLRAVRGVMPHAGP